jgi:hypothetical protein
MMNVMVAGDKAIIDALREENEFLRQRNEMLKGIRTENFTLRDQFAMAALTGFFAPLSHKTPVSHKTPAELLAKKAYKIADAMLAQREVGK